MIIEAQKFWDNPDKYYNDTALAPVTIGKGGKLYSIMPIDYDEYEASQIDAEALADVEAGNFLTLEQFKQHAQKKMDEAKLAWANKN